MTRASEIAVAVVITAVVVAVIAAILLSGDGPTPSPSPSATLPPPPPLLNVIDSALEASVGGCQVKKWPFSSFVSTKVNDAKLTVRFSTACGNVRSLDLVNWLRMCVPKPAPSPSPGPTPTPACTPAPFECFEPGCTQPGNVSCVAGTTANTFVCDLKLVHPGFYKYTAEIRVTTSPGPLTPEPVIEIGDW
jgi:hypothetical protein